MKKKNKKKNQTRINEKKQQKNKTKQNQNKTKRVWKRQRAGFLIRLQFNKDWHVLSIQIILNVYF